MKHRYYVKGVTCSSCKEKITAVWMAIPAVTDVSFMDNRRVDVTMDEHIPVDVLQEALDPLESYTVLSDSMGLFPSWLSWLLVYKWLILIISVVIGLTILDTLWFRYLVGWQAIMMSFMGRWFVCFSALKLYNLRWFVDGFVSYDVLAMHWRGYAWLYPFVELALWLAFLFSMFPLFASIVTLVVMIVGTIGVWKALGKQIQCVCIGTFFSLPLTKVTIVENLFMACMAMVMIVRKIAF